MRQASEAGESIATGTALAQGRPFFQSEIQHDGQPGTAFKNEIQSRGVHVREQDQEACSSGENLDAELCELEEQFEKLYRDSQRSRTADAIKIGQAVEPILRLTIHGLTGRERQKERKAAKARLAERVGAKPQDIDVSLQIFWLNVCLPNLQIELLPIRQVKALKRIIKRNSQTDRWSLKTDPKNPGVKRILEDIVEGKLTAEEIKLQLDKVLAKREAKSARVELTPLNSVKTEEGIDLAVDAARSALEVLRQSDIADAFKQMLQLEPSLVALSVEVVLDWSNDSWRSDAVKQIWPELMIELQQLAEDLRNSSPSGL